MAAQSDDAHASAFSAPEVPIWLAATLKKRGKCTIQPPEWMSVGLITLSFDCHILEHSLTLVLNNEPPAYNESKLTKVLETERDTEKFQPLPFHYVEISRLLFDHAVGDIPDVYLVRSLIEDIKDVRFHKIGTGLEIISKERTYALRLKNLSAMEANIVRPFVTRSLQTFYKLSSPDMIQDQDAAIER
ncbi:OLC1v1008592C1 [Oldenlandia corymbosa var. corymbosa]|uniref:OLC1v1008592C1 n=1 Tax=Oldenlandia corymbosa var. corymbosa TaxID=529605 RepID=A0AAV1DLV7_OLDCO|nr:OLC1v1008592C1 [Oldenlandia corymbosa var. corymbosa]